MLRLSAGKWGRSYERHLPSWRWVMAAVASYLIYASAVMALHQYHDNSFCCERVGLAAAVSNVVYGAPLGKVYPAIQAQFLDMEASVEEILDRVTHLSASPQNPLTVQPDGNGIGFITAASWAMRLFGPHLFAIPLFTLGLFALSAGVFLWRFPDDRSAVVTVSFLVLTLMLCTPLVWDPGIAGQIAIGGIRYFSLLGVVPAFHIVLEVAEQGGGGLAKKRDLVLLAVQTIILVLAVLVRGSAASVAGPIFLVGLVKVWRSRCNRNESRSLRRKAAIIAMVGAVFVGSLLAVFPSRYMRDGRVTTVFWHRVVISLGINPAWPFGNLREVYHCENGGIPDGLVPGAGDRNGGCIWWHWVGTHDIPTGAAISGIYGRQYESVMRATFFDIARLYPREVVATFLYYKPKWLLQSMEYIGLNSGFNPSILTVLVIAGFGNFVGLLIVSARFSAGATMLCLTGLGLLFGIFTIPSYLVAWATPHTIADLLFYCLFCIGTGLGAALETLRAVVSRASAARASAA
jgi:hypothetical protein